MASMSSPSRAFFAFSYRFFNFGFFRRIDFIAKFFDIFLHTVNQRIGVISCFNQFFAVFIFFRVRLSIAN